MGWVLIAVGLAALILPGPGLLALFAGLALLASQYRWAARMVRPVKTAAFTAATEGVRTPLRIAASAIAAAALIAAGIVWIGHPAAPTWWPLSAAWWLPGGWATGAALLASGLLGASLLAYSYRTFRGSADACNPPPRAPSTRTTRFG